MTTTISPIFDTYEIPVDFYVEPESSFIDVVAYDETDGSCYVVIHGTIYRYEDVFYGDYKDLVTAESVGRQYHEFSKTYGPSRSLPGGGSFGLRSDDSGAFPEDSEYTSVSPETLSSFDAEVLADLAASDEAVKEETTSLQRFLNDFIPPMDTENSPEASLPTIDVRIQALDAAATIFQGRKARASEVIATAKKFEEYINGTN